MQELNGIVIINKPKGFTSHDVVQKVKKIIKAKKIGHTGTLDPNATGVSPLLLNQGTKLSKYFIPIVRSNFFNKKNNKYN